MKTWKTAAVNPNVGMTVMDATPRGDENHQPLTVNPYDKPQFDPQNAVDYENGYQYAQSFGHIQLNQADADQVDRWSHAPIPWREGFAEAARRLGVGRLADMIEGSMKEAELVPWEYNKTAGVGRDLGRAATRFAPVLGAAAGYGVGSEVGEQLITPDAIAEAHGLDYDRVASRASDNPLYSTAVHIMDNTGSVAGGTMGAAAGGLAGGVAADKVRDNKFKNNPLPTTFKHAGALKTLAGGVAGGLLPIAAEGALGYEVGSLVDQPELGAAAGAAMGATVAPYTAMLGASAGAMHDSTKEQDKLRKNRNLLAQGHPIKVGVSMGTANRTLSGAIVGGLAPIAAGAGLGAGFGELVDIDTPEHSQPGAAVGAGVGAAAALPLAPTGAAIGAGVGGYQGLKHDAKTERDNRRWARMYPQGA